ncbi:MAG: hypothetical protein ACR2JG_14935 [Geodermatophilaceae bacterium]
MILQIAQYLAWIISALLGVWMVQDAVKVAREHDEEFLTTSVEGIDELLAAPGVAQRPAATEDRT